MKKVIIIYIAAILVCFILPVCFTNPFVDASSTPVSEEKNKEKIQNIKLLHVSTNEIEDMNLEEYLYGVVSAEMPASYEEEALKAQAVVARTYTIYQMNNNVGKHGEAQICDDSNCCQAWISKENRFNRWEEDKKEEYWRKITNAVKNTKGKIITYQGNPINAFFHSNSGGMTEIPYNVWRRNWISIFTSSSNIWRRIIFSICIRSCS
ncbi:MAG: SpoIID/LytB domain-containing protein [Clostridia bacterium]|nr:SpoIID/LytB domain-containing protein [Clostridia bacterium]